MLGKDLKDQSENQRNTGKEARMFHHCCVNQTRLKS